MKRMSKIYLICEISFIKRLPTKCFCFFTFAIVGLTCYGRNQMNAVFYCLIACFDVISIHINMQQKEQKVNITWKM